VSRFDDAVDLGRVADDSFAWSVPDGWQLDRGAWGGLVVGALVEAVTRTEPDPLRQLRSLSLQIVAPALVGPHRIDVRPVRIGSAMSTWSGELRAADGAQVATMTAITGRARGSVAADEGSWGVAAMPDVAPADEVPRAPGGAPFPTFTQHLDMRPIRGLPLSGDPAESIGWVAYDDPPGWTAASVIALVDAWWPAALARLSRMPRMSTVNFMANLLVDPDSLAPAEPLLTHLHAGGSAAGYTSERRQLWTRDGRLAVDNLQTIVVDGR
jgi:hypothetical protein